MEYSLVWGEGMGSSVQVGGRVPGAGTLCPCSCLPAASEAEVKDEEDGGWRCGGREGMI